jgi:hypothetical protein
MTPQAPIYSQAGATVQKLPFPITKSQTSDKSSRYGTITLPTPLSQAYRNSTHSIPGIASSMSKVGIRLESHI